MIIALSTNLNPPPIAFAIASWETLISLGLASGWAVAIYRMVKHQSSYPSLFIRLCLITFIVSVLDMLSLVYVFNLTFDPEDMLQSIQSLVFTVVWVPYMYKSKRVKITFADIKPVYSGPDWVFQPDWIAPVGVAFLFVLSQMPHALK